MMNKPFNLQYTIIYKYSIQLWRSI